MGEQPWYLPVPLCPASRFKRFITVVWQCGTSLCKDRPVLQAASFRYYDKVKTVWWYFEWRCSVKVTRKLQNVSHISLPACAQWRLKSSIDALASLRALATCWSIPTLQTPLLLACCFRELQLSTSRIYRKSGTLLQRFKKFCIPLKSCTSFFNRAIWATFFAHSVRACSTNTFVSTVLILARPYGC